MNRGIGMSVKSAKRVLEILEVISHVPSGLTVKEVSDQLEFPQSSTFNLMKTLHQEGYLYQDALKKYRLGAKLIHLGTTAMESLDIHSIGLTYLSSLMNSVQETVFMAVLSGGELVYVAKIDSNRSIKTSAQLGFKKPLYCTGLGKAFLTFLPKEERDSLLEGMTLEPITDKTVTDKDELMKQLEVYQQQGYSIDDEENEEGLFCVAAPIFDSSNKQIAAISVAGPKERMMARMETTTNELKKTARTISSKVGYRG